MVDSRIPCDVRKCDGNGDTGKKEKSYFQRSGKFIIFFAVLTAVAFFLMILTVNLSVYLGQIFEFGETGFFGSWEVFFAFFITIAIIPFVTAYVIEKRKDALGK